MHTGRDKRDPQAALVDVLGYLNFSSGAPDPKFLAGLDQLARTASPALLKKGQGRRGGQGRQSPPVPKEASGPVVLGTMRRLLEEGLDRLKSAGGAFQDDGQARAVARLLMEDFPSAYRLFHRDLLFHQSDEQLFRPLFLGRAAEAILRQGGPWDETDRVIAGAIAELNDFVGYRPVAVLENRRCEPYPHEFVRPIPLYIAGAGVGVGPYEELVAAALEILRATDPSLLAQAGFDPEALEELALDPRAYDFDHPVNKRPNYHFGQWDPHRIDNRGRYRRFVLQQVTLDCLL
jgi:hypothetical protein